MKFNVLAILSNGVIVFKGTMSYVPRKGEEIEANGHVYVVECVRHIIREGTCDNFIRLVLKYVGV